jgi:hypothetical protein
MVLALGLAAQAQPVTPHIGYVYPAGGRQGTTFQVAVGGQYLDGVTNVCVSGAGVQAAVAQHEKPLTPKQANDLRAQLKALQEKRARVMEDRRQGAAAEQASTNLTWTAEDQKLVAEIRKKLAAFQRRPSSPAIAETVRLQVTVAAEAEPGQRELRLGTALGLSNPLLFCVGQLPEFREQRPEPGEPLTRRPFRNTNEPPNSTPTDPAITLPAILNGQILPGEVGRCRFHAQQGQQLVIAVSARQLIPYLADAVPGWFQATLALYDAKGKELAYDDDYRFHPDPVLFYKVPKDGEYALAIQDALYRGREDFVYRITLGEVPFVTSIFPLGGPASAQTSVELTGWNLPVDKLTPAIQEPGIHWLWARKGELVSNPVPFAVDTLPEILEREPNNAPESAQLVTLPVIVNGRIDQPGDWDVFRFDGRAGDQVVAEVCARRLDSPLDSVLKLTDATGRQLAFNDDYQDKGSGLNTHHADSYLTATLPADGTYYLRLADAQHQGGPEYGYRLRLSAPRPDFALRVVPSSLSVRAGTSIPLTVYALRKDGFTNEIALALKDAPAGFALSGARVPAGQDQVRLTLTAPPMPRQEPLKLSLEGRATIAGTTLVRPGVPADDMMQAFAYRHLVPAQDLEVAVVGRARPRGAVRLLAAGPVKIPAGGTARVQVGLPTTTASGKVQLELSDPPDGIALREVAPAGEGSELVLACDAAKVKPGLEGNLIVNAFAENAPAPGKQKAPPNRRRASLGTLPAIPFEVVAP